MESRSEDLEVFKSKNVSLWNISGDGDDQGTVVKGFHGLGFATRFREGKVPGAGGEDPINLFE